MKKVAVIILNWNGAKLLRRYLPTVVSGTNGDLADVIVADNGSTDESRDVLATEFPEVKTLLFEENHGFAGGYNLALEKTRYPYTVLLNSDVRTPAGWLEPLVEYMDDNGDVAAVQPKLLHDRDDGREVFEYAGGAGGFLDRNGFAFCRGRVFGTVEEDRGQYDDRAKDVFWATGACLMVRTDEYLRLGGLDTAFFAHMEEIDLCWRIHSVGHRVVALSGSKVYHLGGGSLPQGNPRKTYLNFRNNLLLLHKNMPAEGKRRKLVVRRLYDTVALCVEALKWNWGNVMAILRAHRDFRKMRGAYTEFPTHDARADFSECRRNIVLDYYLKRKHTF